MSQVKPNIHPHLFYQNQASFSIKKLFPVLFLLGLYFFLSVVGAVQFIAMVLMSPLWVALDALGLKTGSSMDYQMIGNVIALYLWAKYTPRWAIWPAYIMIGLAVTAVAISPDKNSFFFIFNNGVWGSMILIIYAYALYIAGKKGHKKYLAKVEAAKASYKVCPHCGEEILPEAKVCKHCSRDI